MGNTRFWNLYQTMS